jgi:hypothetical protein
MCRLLFVWLFLACFENIQAQNLFANGGFEDRNICTEFQAKCAAEAWFRIPLTAVTNVNGTAGFFMGNQYESIVMENIGRPGLSRTFIYTKLLCRPEKGKAYTFTFLSERAKMHSII